QEPNLYGIGTTPSFAIGQRALLVQTEEGNLLWDSISLLDEETITAVNNLGGIQAIAVSHPHFYSSAVEWAKTFDAPLYLHANDKEHVMRPDPIIQFWDRDSKELFGNLTLIKTGGHFDGSTVLHWPAAAGGKGAFFTADALMVASDRRHVSFMWSYPNYIPLAPSKVKQVVTAVGPYEYDRIYSAWWDKIIVDEAKTAVSISAERYLMAIEE
ncbi:MAG: MBL fold metallo-hydrolase, partial [Chloroflexota bacterium]